MPIGESHDCRMETDLLLRVESIDEQHKRWLADRQAAARHAKPRQARVQEVVETLSSTPLPLRLGRTVVDSMIHWPLRTHGAARAVDG